MPVCMCVCMRVRLLLVVWLGLLLLGRGVGGRGLVAVLAAARGRARHVRWVRVRVRVVKVVVDVLVRYRNTERRRVRGRAGGWRGRMLCPWCARECGCGSDHGTELGEVDPVRGIARKQTCENGARLVRKGKDGREETRVVEVCTEGVVVGTRLAPWVAPARQIDENDTERPQICLRRRVRVNRLEQTALAFGREVERRPTVALALTVLYK